MQHKAVHWLAEWKLVKHEQERMDKISVSLDRYHAGAMYLKSHGMVLVNVFLITIVQRVSLFCGNMACISFFWASRNE